MKNDNKRVPVVINCDTDIDDAVAVLMAKKNKKLNVKLLSIDTKDSSDNESTANIFGVLKLLNCDEISVAMDSNSFINNNPSNTNENEKTLNNIKILDTNIVDSMYNVLKNSEQKITIINICPLTKIAELLKTHSDCKDKIEKIVVMAGSLKKEHEFNFDSDVESFEYILKQKLEIVIIPKEISDSAFLDWEDVFKTKNLNYAGEQLELIYRGYKESEKKHGIALNDCLPVAYLINSKILKSQTAGVEVLKNDTSYLNFDFNKNTDSNVSVCTGIEKSKFKKIYFKCLKNCK